MKIIWILELKKMLAPAACSGKSEWQNMSKHCTKKHNLEYNFKYQIVGWELEKNYKIF